ncbi:MAG: hypothetical protein E7069_12150 [Bacteroidales bacterium]|jgi:hypothetical protein|nr:hypothetical protein [Bacteroidales bacterium]
MEAKYLFEQHYGKCTLTDPNTGLIIEWTAGEFNATQGAKLDRTSLHTYREFNATQDAKLERTSLHTNVMCDDDVRKLASKLAHKVREMADYIRLNYPELI